MNENQNDYGERIAKVETRVDNMEDRISDISAMKDAVIELKVLQEKTDKRNEKFDGLFEKYVQFNNDVAITLKGIDDNLQTLNSRVETIEMKQDKNDELYNVNVFQAVKDFVGNNLVGIIAFGYILCERLKLL